MTRCPFSREIALLGSGDPWGWKGICNCRGTLSGGEEAVEGTWLAPWRSESSRVPGVTARSPAPPLSVASSWGRGSSAEPARGCPQLLPPSSLFGLRSPFHPTPRPDSTLPTCLPLIYISPPLHSFTTLWLLLHLLLFLCTPSFSPSALPLFISPLSLICFPAPEPPLNPFLLSPAVLHPF